MNILTARGFMQTEHVYRTISMSVTRLFRVYPTRQAVLLNSLMCHLYCVLLLQNIPI